MSVIGEAKTFFRIMNKAWQKIIIQSVYSTDIN